MKGKAMRLFILGATGGTGRQLIDQALARGHQVTAFVRSPEKLGPPQRQGLRVQQGDPCEAAALTAALGGHDAVLSALGPPGLELPGLGRSTILPDSARSTVAAMQSSGIRRLLIVSAAILFEDMGLLAALLRRTLLRNVVVGSGAMEQIVAASNLDWTIVRPPRLTNGPLTERYQIADNRFPSGKRRLSRADVAHFLLDELKQGAHLRQIVGQAG
jgi:putative NADH-flavin reductase